MKTRYIADWIIDMDDNWTDKEGRAVFSTFDEAMRHAIREGKKHGAVEWWRVREQSLQDMDDGGAPMWVTVTRWNGDWGGAHEQEAVSE